MERILALKEQIGKFFFAKHLDFLTSVPQQRIQEIILSSCTRGNSGKLTDYAEVFPTHRTTYGHFLSKGKWEEEKVAKTHEKESFRTVSELARTCQTPVFVSIDDTVIPKTKPSSKAKRPTEGTGWHFSHLEGKQVYGYQVHAAIVSTGNTSLCYSLKRYDKEQATKIQMTKNIIESMADQAGAYFLMDSWYTNPDILHSCEKKGCFLIGAMKTNRILYPNGQRTPALDYARHLLPDQFHPVTVKGRTYLVHRYEGPLNKIPHAVVLLSYPADAFHCLHALRLFLCSDSSLDDDTILAYYSNRWSIEVMFRSQKRYMTWASKASWFVLLRLLTVCSLFSASLTSFSLSVWGALFPFIGVFDTPDDLSAFCDFAHL